MKIEINVDQKEKRKKEKKIEINIQAVSMQYKQEKKNSGFLIYFNLIIWHMVKWNLIFFWINKIIYYYFLPKYYYNFSFNVQNQSICKKIFFHFVTNPNFNNIHDWKRQIL